MTDIDYDNWTRESGVEWDELRYDPESPDECQLCEGELRKGGGRGGAMGWCPECDKTVLLI